MKINVEKNFSVSSYTFEQWFKKIDVKEWFSDNDTVEKCLTCYGEKTHVCECGDVHDCASCDGNGEFHTLNPRYEYEKLLRQEIEKLKEYIKRLENE